MSPHPTSIQSEDAGCPVVNDARPYYSYFDHAKDIYIPPDAKRIALLIGNSDYERGGTDSSNPDVTHLEPLCSPCHDAKAIGNKLVSIGWQKSEVLVLCEQNADELRVAFNALLNHATSDPANPRPLLVYYAGHGIQVSDRNYLIGVETRLDWKAKTDAYIADLKNNQNRMYLQEDEAIDLYKRFEQYGGHVNFPFLILIDACRDNPTKENIDKLFREALASRSTERMRAALTASGLTAARKDPPEGIRIEFATRSGNTIADDDGSGHSRLAGALLRDLVPGIPFQTLMQNVRTTISADNMNADDEDTLTRAGDLFVPASGAWKTASVSDGRGPFATVESRSARFVRVRSGAAMVQRADWTTPPKQLNTGIPSVSAAAARTTFASFNVPPEIDPINVELLWCMGGPKEGERHARANAFAAALKASVERSGGVVGKLKIHDIYVTSFSPVRNASSQYQRYWDAIYADPAASEPDEQTIARTVLQPLQKDLVIERTGGGGSHGYVSVFFCRGAPEPKTTKPLVYVHIKARPLADGNRVVAFLRRRFSGLDIEPTVAVMSEKRDFPLAAYPTATDVRYFRDERRSDAWAIAQALGEVSGTDVQKRPAPIKRYGPNNRIEVWLGSTPPVKPWQDIDLPSRQP